jgi:endoglucanase
LAALLLGTLALSCGGTLGSSTSKQIYINQVGFEPASRKMVVYESQSLAPLTFTLLDETGKTVKTGTSVVKGNDRDSDESLHWIELSDVTTEKSGYQIQIDGERSVPFKIDRRLYQSLKYDALEYFYYNRSGVPIALPWAKDFKWTRPAGHLSDAKVGCIGHSCAYTLNVLGGWYDAGDYGKYVVNGGIALWTLFNLYERTQNYGTKLDDFGDGKLGIPENNNGIPDILDEARFEMEFLLKMQVPEGQRLAGMAHHKIHDRSWSALGRTPAEYSDQRDLYPPSTTATLNLAATAAQCVRLYKTFDPAFSERCRIAAARAWNAANEHPKLYASPLSKDGGGPYQDDDASDEFYWAAAELYVSLDQEKLLHFLRKSPHFLKAPATVNHEHVVHFSSMTWQSTATLGTLTLAMVKSRLPSEDLSNARLAIVRTADKYLEQIEHQGFRVPMKPGSDKHYPWGSNSFVLNNAIILGVAADLSHQSKYRQGVLEAMDYLLGRNPLGFSYISGYGTRFLENPHHRFWAHQKGRRCPTPPPGAIAGGPNSKLPDPISKRLGRCPVQKCYVDHLDAWGVNEVAINWNAPLAWVTAYLDDEFKSDQVTHFNARNVVESEYQFPE